ncbi:hypothetical protein CcI49_03090 [Frankia sp. CcI49]|uniref:hypothetical protein n=1 Tax=unclassified Frankia TaxID=2632575 RepID=UPI0006CA2D84|nr:MULTISPECIES: hypothetical protein [unclassified Frankia]KPM55699.1 hypothetical protein ACG83_10470 [Frankia sp. R43]ONH62379.1 hypothetical protein CcI49_03090 [Frankia sp. CcI49]
MTTAADPSRLARLALSASVDPDAQADVAEWCTRPPRRAGARRRGLPQHRHPRGFVPPRKLGPR